MLMFSTRLNDNGYDNCNPGHVILPVTYFLPSDKCSNIDDVLSMLSLTPTSISCKIILIGMQINEGGDGNDMNAALETALRLDVDHIKLIDQ